MKNIFIFAGCLFFICAAFAAEDEGKLNLFVSIPPQAYFAERVSGDRAAAVTVMVPPGANPHTYEPSPGVLRAFSGADVYMKVGSPVEFEITWIDKLFALNRDMDVCDCSSGIRLMHFEEHGDEHHGHNGTFDPHYWLSPDNAIKMVKNIRDCLIAADPGNTSFYMKNAASLILDLAVLQKDLSVVFSSGKRVFFTFHPAWGYFADEFGLEQISVEYAGKEPSAGQLVSVVKKARKAGIRTVFISPQFNPKSAAVVAAEIGGSVESLDPLAYNYIDNLRRAASAIKKSY